MKSGQNGLAATAAERSTMRVLHLYAGNLYGGIERLLVTLASERDHCPDMEPHFGLCFEGRLSQELRAGNVPVHSMGEVRFSRPWTIWQARQRLSKVLRRERIDIVVCHACWPHAVFAPAVRAAGLPLVFWAHDVPKGTHWLERLAARTRPDLVIANSHFTQLALPRLFQGVPGTVVYCPISVPEIATADARVCLHRDVRRELQCSADAVVIMIASRFDTCKGHRILVEALGRLRRVPDWECWIAGGVQRPEEQLLLDDLRAMAARNDVCDRIRFLGHRSDVARLLAGSDVYCQPNATPESFGISFIEALYASVPVVTSSIGGGMEIVNEKCGILIPVGDVSALVAALQSLISDKHFRESIGANGPSHAAAMCDPAKQVPVLHNVFEAALIRGAAA